MKYKYSLSKDMKTKKTFPFIGVFAAFMVALASASCMKEVPKLPVSSLPSDAITFGVDGSFRAEVQTKATEVTSLSSFYVTAVTGSAGSETEVWNSVQFSQVPGSSPATYAGNKYWPASNPSYKFYGSNVALNFAAEGTYVNASNATDVVCAYLDSPTYNTKNTLNFEHIFARLCRVDVAAQTGYTLSNISLKVTPKTGGTYNLRTKEWSSVATGTATTIASSTGANNNDIFCVPGIYSITASWVATDASGASVTHTNEVCNVPLLAGKTNNISCVLGGDITFGVDLQDYADYDYRDNLDYLTFYCDEAGTIGWKCMVDSYSRTIQYSKDFGSTWNNLTSTASGATFSVSAGDVVWFKGTSSDYMLNSFTLSNKTHVYGNVNSLTGNNTSVGANCFMRLFSGCSNLYTYEHKKIILPATTLGEYCYFGIFMGCSSLTTPPELPTTTLANSCYDSMFSDCSSLTSASRLPATTLANGCYHSMFSGCTSLTTAPELPATTLVNSCYLSMFHDCTSLTTAPELPAMTLASGCYDSMFSGCSSLTKAPELPATTLADGCYYYMFSGCTSLTTAPELPATTLANRYSCYSYMFYGCTSLTSAPELPATTLTNYCYQSMFQGCTSLTTAPALPASTLSDYCYQEMFSGCTSLNYIKALFTTTPSSSYTVNWVSGVAPTGTFVKSAAATWNETGNNGVPTGWTAMTEREAYLANGHAFVDLGLRSNGNKILFATMNIGASAPQEYGDYFAWGETSKRYTSISHDEEEGPDTVVGGSFTWANCPYHTGDEESTGWSKYIPTGKESYTVSGTADNKLVLNASDDVASALWGGSWRMPDDSDLEYLFSSNVTYSWTNNYNSTGVHGYIITGKGSFSSASLFLPAASNCDGTDLYYAGDYGYYWSRSVCSDYPYAAGGLYFDDGDDRFMDNFYRYYGLSVRPVLVIPE